MHWVPAWWFVCQLAGLTCMEKWSTAFVLLAYFLKHRWISFLPSSSCLTGHVLSPHLVLLISYTGQLSLDEFIDGARKDKWVMKMLQMDVNPGGWILEQRRKSALFWENSGLIQLKTWCWLQLWLSCSRVVVVFLFNTISASRWKLSGYLNLKPMCCWYPMNKSVYVQNTMSASSGFWLHPKGQTLWLPVVDPEQGFSLTTDGIGKWQWYCLQCRLVLASFMPARYEHINPKVTAEEVVWQASYIQEVYMYV